MTTDIPGHASPAAGLEVPLEMIAACHQRVERQCATLRRLVAHLARHGADEEARTAAAGVIRYFDTAARDHHADEEADLFPALIEALAGSDPVCVRALVSGLTDEHRALERRWAVLRAELARVGDGDARALQAPAVDAFVDAYARHIAREDDELLPMAVRLLADAELDRIGRAMRARRGLADLDATPAPATARPIGIPVVAAKR